MAIKIRPLVQILGRIIKLPVGEYLDPTTLGSGTADGTKYLRGDGSWQTTATSLPPPDGDKGDITVSGSGAIWTIDNNAVTDAKINDVDGSKVTQSTSYRLVTDTEKNTWNNKQNSFSILTTLGSLANSIGWLKNDGSGGLSYSTPTKSDVGLGSVVNADTTTTANITDSTNKRFVTDAQLTVIGNTSGTNTGDQTITLTGDVTGTGTGSFAASLDKTSITGKTTVTAVGSDYVLISDTSDSGNLKKALASDFAGSGGVTDGDKGDITVSGGGTVWTIDNSTVTEAKMSLADNTTNDVSTTKHGFAPKAPNDATKFLDGTGAYDTVKDSDLSTSDITTNDVSTTKHGFVPKAPNDTTKFLRGDATWAVPTDPAGWTTIVKSANQDVTNSTTFVDDTDLQFSVVAGGNYMIEMDIAWSANDPTGDYKFEYALSTGTMTAYGFYYTNNVTTINNINAVNVLTSADITLQAINTNISVIIPLKIVITALINDNATFSYRFANVAAAAGRTSRTWKGSILRYKRID